MMSEDKRQDILRATLDLISEHGFHGTPMAMIAERASVGAGTIYRYFENKENLIDELFRELKSDLGIAMLVGFNPDLDFVEKVRMVWLNTLNYCMRHPQEMLFLEQFHSSPYLTPEVEEESMHALAPIFEELEIAIRAGVVKDLPREIYYVLTYNFAVSLAKYHIANKLTVTDEVKKQAFDVVWDALKR